MTWLLCECCDIDEPPLTTLRTPNGEAKRVGDVDVTEIRSLLRNGTVRFASEAVG